MLNPIVMNTSLASGKQGHAGPINAKGAYFYRLNQQDFDNSLQANIIFLLEDGSIINANKAACKLLGYSKKELLTMAKEAVFKLSEIGYNRIFRHGHVNGGNKADISIITKRGKLLPCEITSMIFEDANGKSNSVMSIADLSERLLKQKSIDSENAKMVAGNIAIAQTKADIRQVENNDWIKFIAKTSYDVTWDWDITTNLISFGKSYEKVFRNKLPKNRITYNEWMDFFQAEERDFLKQKIIKVFKSDKRSWETTFKFICPDGTLSQVLIRANIAREAHGKKVVRMIGVIHDISKLHKLEGILHQASRIKQKQIIAAVVEAKEIEISDLGKELHDNVNQLLGASMLYLDMARKDITNGDIYLSHSAEYTLTAIEEIRKLCKGWTTDTFKDFELSRSVEHIIRDVMEVHPIKIHCMLDPTVESSTDGKFKLNVFRILQEQLNNILKYAKASDVYIAISQTDEEIKLSIADDGIGFDTNLKSKGIGIGNIISRAELFKGKANFISAPDKGCTLLVTFSIVGAVWQESLYR